jgi:hypothetical protein
MGEVYRARDPRLSRDVAIKILPASASSDLDRRRRFEQEARAVGSLNHPNLLAVFDIGEHEGATYVVFELLEGATLRERLDSGALAPKKVVDYALQIAQGLAAAHEKGIVHRDLKPENLFVTNTGRVKILDFGLAKLRPDLDREAPGEDTPTATEMTGLGTVLGTVGYMSPEQARGRPVDQRSDIFSFGSVLYEMLSGKRAFHRDSAVETMNAILKEDPPELSRVAGSIPPTLERILGRCLEKNPDQRFRSAHDLAFALDAVSWISASSPRGPAVRKAGIAAAIVIAALIGAALLPRAWRPSVDATPPGTVAPTVPAAAEATITEVVTLSRLEFSPRLVEELQERLGTQVAPHATIRPLDGNRVQVSGPESQVRNAASVLRIQDALKDYRFSEEPSLFRTAADSSRPISMDFSGLSQARFLRLIAAAAKWPLVLDPSVQGSLDFGLTDVSWDVAVQTVLDVCRLRASRFGDVWLVSSKERAGEIERRELPLTYRRRPHRTTTAALAAALEAARGESGVVAANPRLNAVVIVDRAESFPAYARIFAAVDRETGPLKVPQRDPYTGGRTSLDFNEGDLQDIFRLFADISGLNTVVEPGIRGRVTLAIEGAPWDNALDVILRSQGLGYQINGNMLRIFKQATGASEIAVETVALKQENPDFFKPFARWLTPAGGLHIEAQSRTLIIRDVRERATWFRQFAEEIDRAEHREPDGWNSAWAVRDRRSSGRWWDGRGVPGSRSPAFARRSDQDLVGERVQRPRPAPPLRPGSARGRQPQPSQPARRLRHRRARGIRR